MDIDLVRRAYCGPSYSVPHPDGGTFYAWFLEKPCPALDLAVGQCAITECDANSTRDDLAAIAEAWFSDWSKDVR